MRPLFLGPRAATTDNLSIAVAELGTEGTYGADAASGQHPGWVIATDGTAGRKPDRSGLVLRAANVAKSFEATVALDGAGVEVEAGEIHALVGGNGSGKSTLLKILAGIVSADAGSVELGGERRDLRGFDPGAARECGLHFVHQQPTVFAELSVAENLSIGRGFEMGRLGRISWRRTRRHAAEVLERFSIPAAPGDTVAGLSPALQTMIAIARALQDQDGSAEGVLALDEPTAALPPREVEWLLEMLRRYAAAGQSILFVSHRLDEVLSVADRITVLRDGKTVGTVPAAGLGKEELAELIVGRPVDAYYREPVAPSTAAPLLEVEALRGGKIEDVSFGVAPGEIVGIAGLAGSGRSTLMRLIYGTQAREAGGMRLGSEEFAPRRPHDSIAAGVAYVSEDRLGDSMLPQLTISENVCVVDPREHWNGAWLRRSSERAAAQAAIGEFGVRAASCQVPISTLSGGNQQKVALARWLRRKPRLLLLDEPTQGVDVGARADLWALMRGAAAEGAAILMVSSDFEELVHLCGRLIVLRNGRTAAEISTSGLGPEEVNGMLHELQTAA